MTNNDWSAEWPTTPGDYWFYGYVRHSDDKPSFNFARVRLTANQVLSVLIGGDFRRQTDRDVIGVWQPILYPALPDESVQTELLRRYAEAHPPKRSWWWSETEIKRVPEELD